MDCPKCHFQNPTQATWCQKCGELLRPQKSQTLFHHIPSKLEQSVAMTVLCLAGVVILPFFSEVPLLFPFLFAVGFCFGAAALLCSAKVKKRIEEGDIQKARFLSDAAGLRMGLGLSFIIFGSVIYLLYKVFNSL